MDKLETSPASQFCDTVDVDKFAVKAVRKKKSRAGERSTFQVKKYKKTHLLKEQHGRSTAKIILGPTVPLARSIVVVGKQLPQCHWNQIH